MDSKNKKILIVDDDEKNRLLFKIILGKEGYETIEAENGQEAIIKTIEEKPDVILMDMMMPIMDGYTAVNILKNNEKTKNIPIIILTALDELNENLQNIADTFLTKPVDIKELIFKVKKCINENS